MIRRTEIREAELPRTADRTLDLDAIVCTYRLTTTRTFAGVGGAGEALYTAEQEVELLSMVLRFGEHPLTDSVVLMPCELSDDRRAAIESQIRKHVEDSD